MVNPAETAYLSFRDRELSNDAALSKCGKEKWQFTPSAAGTKPDCTVFVPKLSKAITFFVLGLDLVKLHIRTRLIETFATIFRTWWCGEEKSHFTPVHTLRQLKRDEALIPPLRRVVEFRARYGWETARMFRGWAKFEERGTHC